jgi:hypothetical protein
LKLNAFKKKGLAMSLVAVYDVVPLNASVAAGLLAGVPPVQLAVLQLPLVD